MTAHFYGVLRCRIGRRKPWLLKTCNMYNAFFSNTGRIYAFLYPISLIKLLDLSPYYFVCIENVDLVKRETAL